MNLKNKSGMSMMTVIITILVMIILASVAVRYSVRMIDDAGEARDESEIYADNEIIRALLTQAITDPDVKVGFPLLNGSVVVIDENGQEYGTGYNLIPGGETDEELKEIKDKTGDDSLTAYKGLSAPYVVDYYTGKYKRIEEIKFK